MNQAMNELSSSVEEVKAYRGNIQALNTNLTGVNQMYQGVLAAKDQLTQMNNALAELGNSAGDARAYNEQLASLNKNLRSLNSVYGNVLSAMTSVPKA
jgi:prefoldin subunit 5